MIKEKTVFILGAGASAPYRYHTGKELRDYICTHFPSDYRSLIKNNPWSARKREIKIGEADKFSKVFDKSNTQSIDLFLASRPEYSEIGKIAIVTAILGSERQNWNSGPRYPKQDWFLYLFNRMRRELNKPDSYKKFGENNVAFITFNYDRFFEHYLYESFINSFNLGIDPDYIGKDFFQDNPNFIPFPVLHVYGKISEVQWLGGYEYGEVYDWGIINNLKDNIRVIYDRVDAEIQNIKGRIQWAERIFFLGFGYAQENLDALEIPYVFKKGQHIYGTVHIPDHSGRRFRLIPATDSGASRPPIILKFNS
jgi:hypothetical protein